MPNLIDSLGHGYFRDFFREALFMYKGQVYSVRTADARAVHARRLSDGAEVMVPNKEFMGFKAFEYPLLGYRRLDDNVIAFLSRVQSTQRGLRQNTINVDYSPVTSRLAANYLIPNPASVAPNAGLRAFEPQWDRASKIDELIAGELTGVVLNERIIVEPSVHSNNDGYAIYFNQALVGTMDARKRTTFVSGKHEKIISPLLKAA